MSHPLKYFFLIMIVIKYNSATFSYHESLEDTFSRQKYFQSFSNEVTGGKLSFEFSEEKGIHCKATEKIFDREVVFKIPSNYVLSTRKQVIYYINS